jgi:hypothetical protein
MYKNVMHIIDIRIPNIPSSTRRPVFSSNKNKKVSAAVINIAAHIGILNISEEKGCLLQNQCFKVLLKLIN